MRRPPPRPAAVAALAVLALAGCVRQAAGGLPPGVDVEDLPASEAWDVDVRTSTDGRPALQLRAPYLAQYDADTAYVYLGPPPGGEGGGTVSVRLYDDEGRPRGSVQASEAWIYDGDGRVVAEGRARATVEAGEGATVEAQRMTLEDGRIDADGSVRASVQGEAGATVQAARVSMAGRRITASGGVQATVRSGGGAQVQAARVVTGPGGAFTASGGATVQIGGRAQATVRARTVSGAGGRYTATGGVRVQTAGGRTLRAERVVWDERAGRFTAPGAFSFDGPGERVSGVGLSATADLSRYTFRRAAGEIEVSE